MRTISGLNSVMDRQKGSTAVVIAIVIVVLLSVAALAVDIGYVAVTKNELQNVADAAALAAARKLGDMYENSFLSDPVGSDEEADIRTTAKEVAYENAAGGKKIIVNDADIVIGHWDSEAKTINVPSPLKHPDAVQVTALRTSGTNGPVSTFFASIFGINSFPVSATATAALMGICTEEPGKVIPIGISQQWFEGKDPDASGFCGQTINFYPTSPDSCAGWNTYESWPASDAKLRKDILEPWVGGSFPPPDAPDYYGGEEFVFIGGNLSENTFDAFNALYDKMQVGGVWETKVVIYYDDDCGNPSGKMTIAGFATVRITAVTGAAGKFITATVKCDEAEHETGGCYAAGTLGSIPRLVH